MSDPRAFQGRLKAAEDRKAARENTNAEMRDYVVLGQIADALFSLRDEVQDIRIAMEAQRK